MSILIGNEYSICSFVFNWISVRKEIQHWKNDKLQKLNLEIDL